MKQRLLLAGGLSVFGGLFLFSTGCYYDNSEDLYPQPPCDTTNVTYSNTIAPIISSNCYACHSNSTSATSGSGISWEGYANLDGYLDLFSGTLLGAIRHENGFLPMPKDQPKLSDCDIRKIEIWISQGHPDN